jgi:hypothetical protein
MLNITTQDYIFHIYLKDRCIYNCLTQDQFDVIWPDLNNMVGILKTDYSKEDLSYEKVAIDREQIKNSSF